MTTDTLKAAIVEALDQFIRQRPGLEPGNYISHGRDDAGRAAYRAEVRSIGKDLQHARALLRAVERSSITGEQLLDASKHAFSGRLTITVDHSKCDGCKQGTNGQFERWEHISDEPYLAGYTPCRTGRVKLDYCTGQYWPTEYRRAVAAVCASALWTHRRETSMPAAVAEPDQGGMPGRVLYDGISAGEWLRRSFRREFGKGIAARWFN